ncbi:MAG: glycosyltransferase family 2 protein [Candidatus Magasanikbacteria bacterium]
MDLTVITVTWNSAKYIADQIESVVLGCEGLAWEQIIVDNASSDETASVIQNDKVRLIKNNKNLGFSAGYNLAIKNATGRYFLYLNPDMKLRGSIRPLIDYLDAHTEAGIASAKLVDTNGRINLSATPRRFPKAIEIWAQFLKLPHLFPKILDRYFYRDFDFSRMADPVAVDSVRGSFMLIRSEIATKLGFAFDPRYFLWWEDVDLCREVKKLGYKIIWHPKVECVDSVGRSFGKRRFFWKQILFFKNALKYFFKWRNRD